MDIETFTTFLGWTSVINIAVLIFSTVLLIMLKSKVAPLHAKMFGLKEADVYPLYFQYLARYKILILAFNLAPYIALRVMA